MYCLNVVAKLRRKNETTKRNGEKVERRNVVLPLSSTHFNGSNIGRTVMRRKIKGSKVPTKRLAVSG